MDNTGVSSRTYLGGMYVQGCFIFLVISSIPWCDVGSNNDRRTQLLDIVERLYELDVQRSCFCACSTAQLF